MYHHFEYMHSGNAFRKVHSEKCIWKVDSEYACGKCIEKKMHSEKWIQKNEFRKYTRKNAIRKKCIQKMHPENRIYLLNAFSDYIFWMQSNEVKCNKKMHSVFISYFLPFFFRRNKITRKKNSTMWKCFFAFFRAWSRIFSSSFSEFISLNSFFWIYFLNLFSENIFWMFLKFFGSDILSFTR